MALRPGGSGVQTYCRELIAALDRQLATPLHARVQHDAIGELPVGVRAETRPVSAGVRRMVDGWRPARGFSLIHGLDIDLPVRSGCPLVTTVHDLSVFDVAWAHSRLRATGERLAVARAIRAADQVIAVSEFTADRVESRFGVTATVSHLAPRPHLQPPTVSDMERIRTKYGLPPEFVLHVGTIEPRKSVQRLADACRRIDVALVLAGASVEQLTDRRGVTTLGYVDEADLAALYGAADAVAYASIYEGFGLPPIEAIACGAAVVATKVGALPEVLGHTYPLVDPNDDDGLADALHATVHDRTHRDRLITLGRDAITPLSWEKTAEVTLSVYRLLGVEIVTKPDSTCES